MTPIGNTEAGIRPGHHDSVDSRSPSEPFMTVFEDDGQTGYFYALDLRREQGGKIVDAIQIYATNEEYADTSRRALRIMWSPDGCKSGLVLDGNLQAAFDFVGRIGCGLSGFPPPGKGWRRISAQSPEQVAKFFHPERAVDE